MNNPEEKTDSPKVQAVLKAALEVFAAQGFAGASMDEIAEQAQVNKAMLYYYVGNKARLYALTLQIELERVLEQLKEALQKAPEDDTGRYFGRLLARTVEGNAELFTLLFREMSPVGQPVKPVVRKFLDGLVALGKAALKNSEHPYLDTVGLLGLLAGVYTQALVADEPEADYQAQADYLLGTYLRGLHRD